jgi:hypothetical protein
MQPVRVLLLALTLAISVVGPSGAQEPARADGWVVISVDDYRALAHRSPHAPMDGSSFPWTTIVR